MAKWAKMPATGAASEFDLRTHTVREESLSLLVATLALNAEQLLCAHLSIQDLVLLGTLATLALFSSVLGLRFWKLYQTPEFKATVSQDCWRFVIPASSGSFSQTPVMDHESRVPTASPMNADELCEGGRA